MESIALTLRMQSDHRFRIPAEVHRDNDDLEEGAWYELEIKDRVKGPAENKNRDVDEDGALRELIAENS